MSSVQCQNSAGERGCSINRSELRSENEAERTKCASCGFISPTPHTGFANHLRLSEVCLEHHRGDEKFPFQGNRETFAIKVALLAGECPAPECHGGSHRKGIPDSCVNWWRHAGLPSMGCRVTNDIALTNQEIKLKIKKFKNNHRNRQNKNDTGARKMKEKTVKPDLCFCHFDGSVGAHLRQSLDCVLMMTRKNFLTRGQESLRQAIFDASLVLSFCPNPDCDKNGTGGGPIEHLGGPCWAFIRSEAPALYGWRNECSIEEIKGKDG